MPVWLGSHAAGEAAGPRPLPRSYQQVLLTIGDHLHKRRLDLGLLQRELAERLGVNESTVTNWELNRTAPELRFLPGIIRFLGYSPLAKSRTIADQIRQGRQLRGLSQQKMAQLLELDASTIAKYERGFRRPRGHYLAKIRSFLTQASETKLTT